MAEIWYYTSEGKQMDPVSLGELRLLAKDGTLKPTDMVWKDGMPRWVRASSATELFPDPSASIDQLFNAPAASDKNTASAAPATSNATAPPKEEESIPVQGGAKSRSKKPYEDDEDDARPRPKKRRKDDDDEDEEDDRRRRRRAKPAPASSGGLVIGLVIGGVVLLMVIIIAIVVVVSSRPNPRPPVFVPRPGNMKPVQINVPMGNPNPNPNVGFGPPQIGNQTTHLFQVQAGGTERRPVTLKAGARYFITATSEPRQPDVDLYLEFNGQVMVSDVSVGPDSHLDYTTIPNANGLYHLRVVNLGNVNVVTKVVVAEVVANQEKPEEKKIVEKEEPLPQGVVGGTGTISVKSLVAGADHTFKLQVRGGKAANVRVTTHLPRPKDAEVNLYVVRDSDQKQVASDETPGFNCQTQITSEKTEVYTVRVHNKSSEPVRCTISYGSP
jgi:hypothetical protein